MRRLVTALLLVLFVAVVPLAGASGEAQVGCSYDSFGYGGQLTITGAAGQPYRASHRPDDPHAAHLWVPSEADVLLVPPLHADEIAELLIHHRLPSRMAGRIHRASGGNPRLALAVGRSLADARA